MSERKGEREVTCVDSANILRKLPIFPVNVKLAQFADAILKPVKQADPEATLAVCKMLCSLCVGAPLAYLWYYVYAACGTVAQVTAL